MDRLQQLGYQGFEGATSAGGPSWGQEAANLLGHDWSSVDWDRSFDRLGRMLGQGLGDDYWTEDSRWGQLYEPIDQWQQLRQQQGPQRQAASAWPNRYLGQLGYQGSDYGWQQPAGLWDGWSRGW